MDESTTDKLNKMFKEAFDNLLVWLNSVVKKREQIINIAVKKQRDKKISVIKKKINRL